MTITAVGSPVTGNNGNTGLDFTVTVNPTAIGDILVCPQTERNGSFAYGFALSGGGVTTWNYIGVQGAVPNSVENTIMWGVVTSTGSQTLNVTAVDTGRTAILVQQFHDDTGGQWTASVVANLDNQSGSSGNFVSLTPAISSGIYAGVLNAQGTPTGSSSGYTYTGGWGGLFVYQVNTVSGTAYSPNWSSGSSGTWCDCAAIIGITTISNNLVMLP